MCMRALALPYLPTEELGTLNYCVHNMHACTTIVVKDHCTLCRRITRYTSMLCPYKQQLLTHGLASNIHMAAWHPYPESYAVLPSNIFSKKPSCCYQGHLHCDSSGMMRQRASILEGNVVINKHMPPLCKIPGAGLFQQRSAPWQCC